VNRLLDFHEIWWAGDHIEIDLKTTIFSAVAQVIPKWRRLSF
jgi:hypothetical protein